jgi:hypothetical protein
MTHGEAPVSVHQSMGRFLFGNRFLQVVIIEPHDRNDQEESAASLRPNSGRRQEKGF